MKFVGLGLLLGVFLVGFAQGVQAVPVRMASFNVAFGIDTGSDAGTASDVDLIAVSNIIKRIQPDIICFQELYANEDKNTWITLAARMGYPYFAMSSGGSLDNSMRTGVWSKFPITATDLIKETLVDSAAIEFMRWPIVAKIEVPGALYPFWVAATHNKAGTTSKPARLQRGIEIYRIAQFFERLVAANPAENVQYAIMGDFNDDIALSQTINFDIAYYQLQAPTLGNATAPYRIGSDFPWSTQPSWLMPYSKYPTDRLAEVNMGRINPVHTGTNLTWTHYHSPTSGNYRLDYIHFSEEIMESAYGAPTGEVYNSEFDGAGIGLFKPGPIPPKNTSMNASDHRMLFADFHLIDALSGITPVAIISEVVAHSNTNGNYVEICNSGASDLNLSGYSLGIFLNGATNFNKIALSGTLAGGAVRVVATSTNGFLTHWPAWGRNPNQTTNIIGSLNGNDTVALFKPNGVVSDIFGKIGAVPGAWAFTNKVAERRAGISDPHSIWDSAEWNISAFANATPGSHKPLIAAAAFLSTAPSLDPTAPLATNLFAISAGITPNLLASNLTATGRFRIGGGGWIEAAMVPTSSTSTTWRTPWLDVAKSPGDVLDYEVAYAYEGPDGFHTNFSALQSYTIPVFGVSSNLSVLFNELRSNGAGTDTNAFIELIGVAGADLSGAKIVHYNGAPDQNVAIWTFTFPANSLVPNDGILGIGGRPLGFVVISHNAANVPNTDYLLPSSELQNGPDAVILHDAKGNILDAIVWKAAFNDVHDIDIDSPGTVSKLVTPRSPIFLHEIGVDQNDDLSLQAPNRVLTGAGGWVYDTATPGTLNRNQTNALLVVSAADLDFDGLMDDEDNCPTTFNPTQNDTDGDGLGDHCDPDMDNDGFPNASDNCPYIYNPDQADLDGDGIGDACDPDFDGDGIPNIEDNCQYQFNPFQDDRDGDGVGDDCDPDRDGDGIRNEDDPYPDYPGTPPTFNGWVIEQGGNPASPEFAPDADSDGDGMTTQQEYIANTDPRSPNSVMKLSGTFISATHSDPGKLVFTFPSSTTRYYQLLYKTNLLGPFRTNDLGWGQPNMVITNSSSGNWFGGIRVLLDKP